MNGAPGNPGLFSALKNTAATLLGMAQTRLELAGLELQLEKVRLLRQVALAFGIIISAAFGVLLLVALTTLLFWEHRIAVVAGFTGLFAVLAWRLYAALRRSIETSEPLFSGSISELQKDLAQLKKAVDAQGDVKGGTS
jgi:uncharacterized membrane protein YqjE